MFRLVIYIGRIRKGVEVLQLLRNGQNHYSNSLNNADILLIVISIDRKRSQDVLRFTYLRSQYISSYNLWEQTSNDPYLRSFRRLLRLCRDLWGYTWIIQPKRWLWISCTRCFSVSFTKQFISYSSSFQIIKFISCWSSIMTGYRYYSDQHRVCIFVSWEVHV